MAILHSIRRLSVALRDRLDGYRHPRRGSVARDRLRRLQPTNVLFVCLGNICRSPYAARAMLPRAAGVDVHSAGFILPGRPPPEKALEAASVRGTDHSDHRSKLVTEAMMEEADAVFVFDRFNVKRLRSTPGVRMDRIFWLGDFDPIWTGKRAIIDPWGKPLEDFEKTFASIDRVS